MRTTTKALTGLLALALAAGCGEGFDPPSYLDDLRVLALVTDPIEVVYEAEGGAVAPVTATAWLHLPPGAEIADEGWDYCVLSAGPFDAYRCLFPEDCRIDLTGAARMAPGVAHAEVTFDPSAVGARCAARLAREQEAQEQGSGADLPGDIADAAAEDEIVFDTYLRYRVATRDGQERIAVQRIPVWFAGEPAYENGAPVIERVEIDEVVVAPGASVPPALEADDTEVSVRVVTAADSVDTFVDDFGRTREEEIFVSFYATAGRFELQREIGVDVSVTWEPDDLEDDEREALVYVVARDIRGGQDVSGPFRIPIERAPAP